MKKFDQSYILLEEMYEDDYYPAFLVDKIKELLEDLIYYLEEGETDKNKIQDKLDEITRAMNLLDDEFEENDSDLETIAHECIAENIEYILQWFQVEIDIETAIREREW